MPLCPKCEFVLQTLDLAPGPQLTGVTLTCTATAAPVPYRARLIASNWSMGQ